MFFCGSGGMADAQASGACGSNTVWVQVPSSALRKKGARPFQGRVLFLWVREPRPHGFKVSSSTRSAPNRLHWSLAPHLPHVAGKSTLQGSRSPRSIAASPCTRREKGPLDLFLIPPRPIFSILFLFREKTDF